MKPFTKRLLAFALFVACFATATFALSQVVSYKPWGVPDSKRAQYENTLDQLSHRAQQSEAMSGKPIPRIRMTPTLVDFGWVEPGETLERSTRVENVGDADLELAVRSIRSPGLKADLQATTLRPGEHADCRIVVTAAETLVEGVQQQTFTMTSNDPLQSTVVVALKYQQKSALVVPSQIKLGSHDIDDLIAFDFDVYSQLFDTLEIKEISSEGFEIDWVAEVVDTNDGETEARAALAARRLTITMKSNDYGSYSGFLRMVAVVDGRDHPMAIPFNGRTKPPIGFYGPHVDTRTGVDFGVLESGTRHDLYVTVRSRADKSRSIEVLGVEPKQLQSELTPLNTEGSYRLRISIPADCPDLRFNLDQHRGYIEIGDPESPSYSSWLPVYGAVSRTSR